MVPSPNIATFEKQADPLASHSLEEIFSVPFFDRPGKEVILTPSGEILLKYVNQVDALLA
jgi:hypothetical protein